MSFLKDRLTSLGRGNAQDNSYSLDSEKQISGNVDDNLDQIERDSAPIKEESYVRNLASAITSFICTASAIVLLGIGLQQGKQVMTSGTLHWKLSEDIKKIIDGGNAAMEKTEEVINTGLDKG